MRGEERVGRVRVGSDVRGRASRDGWFGFPVQRASAAYLGPSRTGTRDLLGAQSCRGSGCAGWDEILIRLHDDRLHPTTLIQLSCSPADHNTVFSRRLFARRHNTQQCLRGQPRACVSPRPNSKQTCKGPEQRADAPLARAHVRFLPSAPFQHVPRIT